MRTISQDMHDSGNRSAFTLLEIMVSAVVLSLITVLLAQTINGTTVGIQNSRSRLEADQEARSLFDRMGSDIASMPKERGIDYIFSKQDGNDKMFFYSQIPGYFGPSTLQTYQSRSPFSLVGYRINANASQFSVYQKLQRLAKGLQWESSADAMPLMFLTCSGTSFEPLAASTIMGTWRSVVGSAPDYQGNDSDYSVFSEFVYRLEFCFQLKDGTYSNKPVMAVTGIGNNLTASAAPTLFNDSAGGYTPGSRWYDVTAQRGYLCVKATPGAAVWYPLGLEDVSSLVVAIAVLDPTARKSVSDLRKAISAFPDPSDEDLAANPPKLMAAKWETIRNQPSFATSAGLSGKAPGKIYIYQHYFSISSR